LGILSGVALLALCALGVSSAAYLPLAGNLDLGFGSDGVVTHSLGSGEYPAITAIAVQPDAKIVVAADAAPGDRGFLLARYLPDGTPDPSFGQGGYVETEPPAATYARAKAVALQADGKIVVAGVSDRGQFTLARYNPDGSLDTSFGTNGITNTVIPEQQPPGVCFFSSQAYADALAALPNGDILAGGSSEWDDGCGDRYSAFALARYTPDGSLDPIFGDGGIVQTTFSGAAYLAGIAVQPNGKIVASGTSFGPGHGDGWQSMALARYQPDGSLDPDFGSGGKVTTAHKLAYGGGPLTLQHGEVVVAGFTRLNSGANDFPVLARYQKTGRLDPTFGKSGFAELRSITGREDVQGSPTDVVAQPDGKLLITAADSVARLTPNGTLDKSFGRGGIVSLGGGVDTSALALQAQGKILVGGSTGNTLGSGGNTWLLAEFLAGNNCVVPGIRGKTVAKASATLKKSYCRRGRIAKRFSSKVMPGRVISTAPSNGARQLGGAAVNLIVSKGKRP
jgi:uncharacterized delta-60 repeat protein